MPNTMYESRSHQGGKWRIAQISRSPDCQARQGRDKIPNNCYCLLRWVARPEEIKMAISVDLGNQLEKFVTSLVESGRYNSKSEVLREGIRLIQEREAHLAALDPSIARGIADAEAGRVTSAATVFDRLEAKYSELANAKTR